MLSYNKNKNNALQISKFPLDLYPKSLQSDRTRLIEMFILRLLVWEFLCGVFLPVFMQNL